MFAAVVGQPTLASVSTSSTPPAGQIWIGEGFADNACLNFETSGGSSAPQTCISVCSTCTAAKSAGWLLESVAARGEAVDEKDGLGFTSASECALPDVLRFVDASGVQREVKLPQDEEGFKKAHQLASAGNLEALLAL
ncbi:hypothetical protein ONZ45_g840 [Pleurotus djamor]|nr:hypothetical protein ONZ45_g840 [Pleurotus djamor]